MVFFPFKLIKGDYCCCLLGCLLALACAMCRQRGADAEANFKSLVMVRTAFGHHFILGYCLETDLYELLKSTLEIFGCQTFSNLGNDFRKLLFNRLKASLQAAIKVYGRNDCLKGISKDRFFFSMVSSYSIWELYTRSESCPSDERFISKEID